MFNIEGKRLDIGNIFTISIQCQFSAGFRAVHALRFQSFPS